MLVNSGVPFSNQAKKPKGPPWTGPEDYWLLFVIWDTLKWIRSCTGKVPKTDYVCVSKLLYELQDRVDRTELSCRRRYDDLVKIYKAIFEHDLEIAHTKGGTRYWEYADDKQRRQAVPNRPLIPWKHYSMIESILQVKKDKNLEQLKLAVSRNKKTRGKTSTQVDPSTSYQNASATTDPTPCQKLDSSDGMSDDENEPSTLPANASHTVGVGNPGTGSLGHVPDCRRVAQILEPVKNHCQVIHSCAQDGISLVQNTLHANPGYEDSGWVPGNPGWQRSSSGPLDLNNENTVGLSFNPSDFEFVNELYADVPDEVQCLPAEEDNYNGIVVDILKFPSKDIFTFKASLRLSLEQWRSQKKKGIWLKLPTEYGDFVPPAIQEGFKYHHAEETYAMLVLWLGDEPTTLPANASHGIGVGAFVLSYNDEILAVQERLGLFQDKWKMPSGVVQQGEDVFAGAIREVKEESGIETEFVEVIGFRQSHNGAFGKSDLYFLCVLRPLTSKITVQTVELVDAKWIPLAEFKAQQYLSERKMLGRMLDVCTETSTARARKGFKLETVQAGTKRAPQYFYNSSQ